MILAPKHLEQLAPQPLRLPGLPDATAFFLLFSPLLLLTRFCKAPGRMLNLRRPLCPGKKQREHKEPMTILEGSKSSVGLFLALERERDLEFPKLTTERQHQATSEGEKPSFFRTRKVKPVAIMIYLVLV